MMRGIGAVVRLWCLGAALVACVDVRRPAALTAAARDAAGDHAGGAGGTGGAAGETADAALADEGGGAGDGGAAAGQGGAAGEGGGGGAAGEGGGGGAAGGSAAGGGGSPGGGAGGGGGTPVPDAAPPPDLGPDVPPLPEGKIAGVPFGAGSTWPQAFDCNDATAFSEAQGTYAGLEAPAPVVLTRVRFRTMMSQAALVAPARVQGSLQRTTGYVDLHTFSQAPPDGWTDVAIAPGAPYTFFRLHCASGGCAVAELQFYGQKGKTYQKLCGRIVASHATGPLAFDGNPATHFETGFAGWVAMDVGEVVRLTRIRYHPGGRAHWMVGGQFDVSTISETDPTLAPVFNVTTLPADTWQEIDTGIRDFRYLRYRGPLNANTAIGELEFWGEQ